MAGELVLQRRIWFSGPKDGPVMGTTMHCAVPTLANIGQIESVNTKLTMSDYAHDADTSWITSKLKPTFGGKLVKRTLRAQGTNAPMKKAVKHGEQLWGDDLCQSG